MSATMQSWWQNVLLIWWVRRVAAAAMIETWPRVRTKTAGQPAAATAEYVEKHAAAVVHRHVEALMHEHPTIDSAEANALIVRATERLNRQLLQRLAKQTRSASRAA